MKKTLLVVIALVFSSVLSAIAAPTLPDKCQVFYPDILLSSPVIKEADMKALEKAAR